MKLKLSRGATINMGNYKSYRFDVGLEEDFEATPIEVATRVMTEKVGMLFNIEMAESKKQRSRA